MKAVSLFAGVGGFDLALTRGGKAYPCPTIQAIEKELV